MSIAPGGTALRAQDDGLPLPDKRRSPFARLRSRVESLRGKRFRSEVPLRSLSRDELVHFYELDFADSDGDGKDSTIAWKALGLLPREDDLRTNFLGKKRDGVYGFYLFKTMGPFSAGELFLVPENHREDDVVLFHELVHALDDQTYGLARLFDAIPRGSLGRKNADQVLALQCLEEGTATVFEKKFATDDLNPSTGLRAGVEVGTSFLGARSDFRYVAGRRFVSAVLEKGGLQLLDRVYAAPPQSTREIFHPEEFLAARRDPIAVHPPDMTHALPGSWRIAGDGTLGPFAIDWLTGAELEGWEGDGYVVLEEVETHDVVDLVLAARSARGMAERGSSQRFVLELSALDPQGLGLGRSVAERTSARVAAGQGKELGQGRLVIGGPQDGVLYCFRNGVVEIGVGPREWLEHHASDTTGFLDALDAVGRK